MKKIFLMIGLTLLLGSLISACSRTSAPNFAEIPAGKAFADGEEIFFSHTEVSDASVAEVLTTMMKSPVLLVPSLAEIPDSSLAKVYVFKNGVAGSGPLKFQADVFPNQPGDPDYSPLRKIVFVSWTNEGIAEVLKSEEEINARLEEGAIILEETDIVVNMPFMTWKGGQR